MFNERKQGMIDKTGYAPGDDNSTFYTKPDEAPISHPAEVLERLKKEKPDANMEDLVKEADEIVNQEMKDRQKQRDEAAKATEISEIKEEEDSTEAKIEETKDDGGEPEVSSK